MWGLLLTCALMHEAYVTAAAFVQALNPLNQGYSFAGVFLKMTLEKMGSEWFASKVGLIPSVGSALANVPEAPLACTKTILGSSQCSPWSPPSTWWATVLPRGLGKAVAGTWCSCLLPSLFPFCCSNAARLAIPCQSDPCMRAVRPSHYHFRSFQFLNL